METDSARLEPDLAGQQHQIDRHVRVAAELARQRPVGRLAAFGQNPAEDPGARRLLRNVAQVRFAVGCEKGDALFMEVTDIRGLLDRISVADAVRGNSERQHPVQLVARRDIEMGTQVAQQLEHLNCRIRFHRIIDFGERKMRQQLFVIPLDNIEVHHQKRSGMAVGLLFHEEPVFFGVIVQNVNPHCFFDLS